MNRFKLKTHPALKLNHRILPVLVGVLILVQLFAPFDGWKILLVGLGGAWLTAYLWARSLAAGLSVQRKMRFGWAQVGDYLEERFTVANRSPLPALWVEVIDHTNVPGYSSSRVTGVGSLSENSWQTSGVCAQRGLFTHGPTSLRTSDPLGIYNVELHDAHAADLLVTPPIVPLPQIEVAAGGRAGEGRPRPDAPERTVSSAGVRQFAPGDSLRWIHWRTTARRAEPYVHLFEGTPAGDWWIVLDLDHRVQAGQGQSSTVEHGVILAASLADRGLRLGKTVGLAANSAGLTWLNPKDGDNHRWEILHALALAEPGERPLGELLTRMKRSFSRRSSLIIITANVAGEWIKDLLPLLWAGVAPTVLLLDPVTFGGTGSVQPSLDLLASLRVSRYVISRDVLDRPEARPGKQGRREWRVTPTGRAVLVNPSTEQNWKSLS